MIIEKELYKTILAGLSSSFRCLNAANNKAPPAPKAAAGVGLVIPPKIDPRTAIIKIKGGNTTLNNSFLDKFKTANLKP